MEVADAATLDLQAQLRVPHGNLRGEQFSHVVEPRVV
jgi:hypothetical protein